MGGEPVWLRIKPHAAVYWRSTFRHSGSVYPDSAHIPVAKQQANQSWTTLLGLDAFALFKNKRMAIFFIFSMLLGAELQITNMFGNTFLHSFDKDPMFASSFIVQHASIIMSISQISETLFILTIPFFLSRYGIKNVMMISIVAWILRFALFAYGDPTPFVLYCWYCR